MTLPLSAFGVESHVLLGLDKPTLQEFGKKGEKLNQESGSMPFIGFGLSVPIGSDWLLLNENTYSSGSLEYDGQLQNGIPYRSSTDTKFIDINLGIRTPSVASLFSGKQYLLSKLGYHRWERNIEGVGNVSDLNETYKWQSISFGLLHENKLLKYNLQAEIFKTFNSSMDINIPNLGDASLSLPDGQGFRLKATYQLNESDLHPIKIGIQYYHNSTSRSESFPLTNNGKNVGYVTEPEHELQRITTFLQVVF